MVQLQLLHVFKCCFSFSAPFSLTFEPLNADRFLPINEKLNFDEAKENCNNMGAKLFEPRNYHEDEFVMNLTKTNDWNTGYWIGINRRLDGKSVYSSDNSPISWSHFEALAKPEKQHTPLCTVISFNNGMGGWKDKDCSLKRHSVCDKHIGKPFFIFPSLLNQLVQKITSISFLEFMFQLFFLSYLELYRLIHILQD